MAIVMNPSIDPRYSFMLARFSAEEIQTKTREYIAVTAKVSNLEEWKRQALHAEAQLGAEVRCGENWIVTAQIPFFHFPQLNNLTFVRSLKIVTPLFLDLDDTVREIGLVPSSKMPATVLDQGGENVVVGIVDVGCDFAHRHFINSSNRTRIHSIWVQRDVFYNGKAQGITRDRYITENQINTALLSQDPHTALNYTPSDSHGTHVMDIAAGSGPNPGVAPKAKIVFVDLVSRPEIAEDIKGIPKQVKLIHSKRLIDAVQYIFDQAKNLRLPCVVNLSLGQHGGPHDGTTLVEEAFDRMLEEPNRAIVISAGNSYEDDRSHCSSTVKPGSFVELKWEMTEIISNPDVIKENELEIWYSGNDEFQVDILYTDGRLLDSFPIGKRGDILLDGTPIGYAYHRKADGTCKGDPQNGDHVFQIFHNANGDPDRGLWTLRLHGMRVVDGTFHAWIERGSTSNFLRDDPRSTINSIGTGRNTIVVGAYNAHRPGTPIYYASSAGPTRARVGWEKPEVSAPGQNSLAAFAMTTNGVTEMSGTSMAAPAVTGLVARILGQAYEKKINPPLGIDDIRKALISTCRKNPPSPDQVWDPRYGFGRVYAGSILAFASGQPSDASVAKKSIDPNQPPPPTKPPAQDSCSSNRCGTRPCTCPITNPFFAYVVANFNSKISHP